uniref:U3 small nucleolar RNA-associated protein 14 homolog A n=1 Tax=Anopheles epiroticus TaxID=199890 RepID=A0A182P8Z4_9DIPT
MPVETENDWAAENERNDYSDGEDAIDPKAHAKLINGINNLTGSHFIHEVTRTEPSLKRSEFGLSKTQDDKVRLGELAKFFTKTKKHNAVAKQLNKLKVRQPLQRPLEKPAADRIERKAAFERVQKDLDRWEPVVTATQVAPQTVYPLLYGETTVHDEPPKKLSEYRVKTKLMEAMEELEKAYEWPDDGASDGEQSDDAGPNYELTLEEMREQQRERARQKLRESYEIAKCRRLNKIKSKKYHRLLKKDKLKEQMKKFEELKEKNPEEALRQLDRIEKQRFQERVTLRHKNTGTWAKNLQVRAKYDTEVRRELAEQLAIGRELTAKRLQQGDSSSESDGEPDLSMSRTAAGSNPWTVRGGDYEQHAGNEMKLKSGYRKYWEERNQIESLRKELNEEDKAATGKQTEEGNSNDAHLSDEDDRKEPNHGEKLAKEKVKNRLKKRKDKVTKTSGGWNVEDIEEMEQPKCKKKGTTTTTTKVAKKRKTNDASVEDMFQEAEELIQEVLSSKLELVQRSVHEEQKHNKNHSSSLSEQQVKSETKSSDLSFKKQARLADADEQMKETVDTGASDEEASDSKLLKNLQTLNDKSTNVTPTAPLSTKSSAEINLKQVVQMKPKHLLTALPNTVVSGELSDDEDGDEAHRLTIAEAFEDDDIVADFAKEKQDARQKDLPQAVELTLPGWGQWAGPGVQPAKKRNTARQMFKPPPVLPRRDDNRDQVIINEDALKNDKLGKHLVNEVPFPYLTVKDYEASLRAPVGRTFIPETAHAAMVEPRVVTKQGTVIAPMKKDMLVQNPATLMRVGKKQQNEAVDAYNQFAKKNVRKPFAT